MLELGGCTLLEADNFPSAVYLSPVETPPQSNEWPFYVCWNWSQISKPFLLCLPKTKVTSDITLNLQS